MARILLITADTSHAAYTRTKAALESKGHTVNGSLDTTTALDAAWAGSSFDLIASVRAAKPTTTPAPWVTWARDKWVAGTPLLIGGTESGALTGDETHASEHLGLTYAAQTFDANQAMAQSGMYMRVVGAHPITTGFASSTSVKILTAENYVVRDNIVTPSRGTEVGDMFSAPTDYGVLLLAFDAGASIHATATLAPGATAPTRAAFCGWLYAGQADYTANGKTILGQAVDWLAPTSAITVSGSRASIAVAGQAGMLRLPIDQSGTPAVVAVSAHAGEAVEPDAPLVAAPDTFNRANGRARTGIAEAWVEYDLDDLAEREPLRIMAQQMPTPNLVDGRPA